MASTKAKRVKSKPKVKNKQKQVSAVAVASSASQKAAMLSSNAKPNISNQKDEKRHKISKFNFFKYISSVRSEISKIEFITLKQTTNASLITLGGIVAFSLLFLLSDSVVLRLVKFFVGF